jgi:hypothetical protein
MVQDANNFIGALDAAASFENLVNTLKTVESDYNAVIGKFGSFDPVLTQAAIDAAQGQVAASGLSTMVTPALQHMGLTPTEIDDITSFMTATPANLAVLSITVSELLGDAANLQVVPEPPTYLMFVVGIVGVLLLRYRSQPEA